MSHRSGDGQYNHKKRGRGYGFFRPTNPKKLRDDDVAMDGVNGAGGSRFRNRHGNDRRQEQRNLRDSKWYRINLRFGKEENQAVVLETLSNSPIGSLKPYQIRNFTKGMSFHVNDKQTAVDLRAMNNRLRLPDGQKIEIKVEPSSRPQSKMTPDVTVRIKEVMSKRYDSASSSLDLSKFCDDPDLEQSDVLIQMTNPRVAETIVAIIGEHIPQLLHLNLSENGLSNLNSFAGLSKENSKIRSLNLSDNNIRDSKEIKGLSKLKLEEISLRNNPVLNMFQDGLDYRRWMRKNLPTLLKLDTEVLPEQVKFNIESAELPPSKGSHFGPDNVRDVICLFLQQYFAYYDTKDRSSLVNAYHANANYSISCCKLPGQRDTGPGIGSYMNHSRNLLRIKHEAMFNRLYSSREAIIEVLKKLPQTVHDMDSLVVDVLLISPTMVVFNVKGVFKEVSNNPNQSSQPAVRQFNRTVVAVPHFEGIAIVNELVNVTNISHELYQKYLEAQKKRPPEPEPIVQPQQPIAGAVAPEQLLTPQQQNEMVAVFSQQSGMNAQFSLLCLSENGWNYEKSAAKFTELQALGAIPPEAFHK